MPIIKAIYTPDVRSCVSNSCHPAGEKQPPFPLIRADGGAAVHSLEISEQERTGQGVFILCLPLNDVKVTLLMKSDVFPSMQEEAGCRQT